MKRQKIPSVWRNQGTRTRSFLLLPVLVSYTRDVKTYRGPEIIKRDRNVEQKREAKNNKLEAHDLQRSKTPYIPSFNSLPQ